MHHPQEASQAGPLEQRSLAEAGQQQPAELTVLLHHRHRRPHQSRPGLISSFDSLKTKGNGDVLASTHTKKTKLEG